MTVSSLAGILCILGLVQWTLKCMLRNSSDKYPDGPRPFGIFGNIFVLRRLQFCPDRELMSIARRWGDTCMLWAAQYPVLIVNKPGIAKELLVDRGSVYSSRPHPNDFRSSIWPWRLPIIPTGEKFRYLRRLYQSLLSPQRSVDLRKYQDFESLLLVSDLLGQPEDFYGDIDRYSLSVIFSAVYGIRLGKLDHPITNELSNLWLLMLQHLQPGSLLVDYIPILQKLPKYLQPGYKYAMRLRRREMQLHFAFYRTLKDANRQGQAPDCFGKHLLEVQEKDAIDDSAAVDILAMIIAGGGHTTSSILQSFFKIMALHPEVVRKAHLELVHLVGLERLPSWEDQASLPYTRCLIKELHRCCGVGGLGVPHATTKDDYYGGRLIPKGASVIPNLTVLHQDTELYPNPGVFEPDRFKNHHLDPATSAIQPDYLQRDHFNYGFGRRLCPGIHIAEQSLFIVISRVLWGFDIRVKPGHTLAMNSKTGTLWQLAECGGARLTTDEGKLAGLIMKHKPFQVDIKSRGSTFSKVIDEARNQSRSEMEYHTLDIENVIVRDL